MYLCSKYCVSLILYIHVRRRFKKSLKLIELLDAVLVPLVLTKCAEVIEKNGIVDGIYRLSGMSSNIQKLR